MKKWQVNIGIWTLHWMLIGGKNTDVNNNYEYKMYKSINSILLIFND
jgi:hypothetical protein